MILGFAVGALALIGVGAVLLAILLVASFGAQMGEPYFVEELEDYVPLRSGGPIPPQWAPDGSAIYSTSDGLLAKSPSYVVSSDGSDLKKLEYVASPRVSPDGSRIVYSTWRDTGEFSYDIETAKLDGSDRRRLTEDPTYVDVGPAWSPDGSRIAFARVEFYNAQTDKNGIYVMAADGSSLRRVYRLRGSSPDDPADEEFRSGPLWSPDGETLAFVIHERRDIVSGEDREVVETKVLYTIEADGSNLVAVYENSSETYWWIESPAWSPDGGSLAFSDYFPYIVNSDGTGLRKAAADIESVGSVAWSPDGTRLLLTGYVGTYGRISAAVADADGGSPSGGLKRLGYGYRETLAAIWSPDGSRIAILEEEDYDAEFPQPYLTTMAPDGSDMQVLVEWREKFGELKAVNSRWEWPWQR